MSTRLKAKSVLLAIIKPVPSSVTVNGRTSKNTGRVTEPVPTFVYKAVESQKRILVWENWSRLLEVRMLLGLEGWEGRERRVGAEDSGS